MKKMIAALLTSMMLIPTMASATTVDVANTPKQTVSTVSPDEVFTKYVTVTQYYGNAMFAPAVIYYTDPLTGASGWINKMYSNPIPNSTGAWVTYTGVVYKEVQ